MLNYYRKKQIRDLFTKINLKNKDIDLIKINRKNYKFKIANKTIYISKMKKGKFYFNYHFFNLSEELKEIYPTNSLLKNNKNLIKIIKKYG